MTVKALLLFCLLLIFRGLCFIWKLGHLRLGRDRNNKVEGKLENGWVGLGGLSQLETTLVMCFVFFLFFFFLSKLQTEMKCNGKSKYYNEASERYPLERACVNISPPIDTYVLVLETPRRLGTGGTTGAELQLPIARSQ